MVDTPLVHGEGGLLDGVSALTGESHEVVMEKYILTLARVSQMVGTRLGGFVG